MDIVIENNKLRSKLFLKRSLCFKNKCPQKDDCSLLWKLRQFNSQYKYHAILQLGIIGSQIIDQQPWRTFYCDSCDHHVICLVRQHLREKKILTIPVNCPFPANVDIIWCELNQAETVKRIREKDGDILTRPAYQLLE